MEKQNGLTFRLFPQFLLKTAMLVLSVTLCLNLLSVRAFSGSVPFLPSLKTLGEAAAFSAVLTGLQYLFLSDRVIRRMAFGLRRMLAAVCTLPAAAGLGLGFGWFRPSLPLLTVLTPVFLLSLFLGSGLLLRIRKSGCHGFRDIFLAVVLQLKTELTAVLAAAVIGLCAGYRGSREFSRPWQDPSVSVSELCRTKDGGFSAVENSGGKHED